MRRIKAMFENLETVVIVSFLLAFFIGFIYPVFFYSNEMFFPQYVPANSQLGSDLNQTIAMAKNPSIVLYSPLAKIIFNLFNKLSAGLAFKIITVISITLLLLLCYKIIPQLAGKNNFFISTFFLVTILMSYGFQFELERGQWNLICIFLIFYSLLLFKNGNKNISILFFSLAVHLKVYPLIFILLFIDNKNSWKQNLIFFMKILIINSILLFIMGWDSLMIYIKSYIEFTTKPYVWIGNHSIAAFVNKIAEHYLDIKYLAQILLLAYMLCLFIVVLISFKLKLTFFNKYLLFLLMVGALIIPSVSHDYTLPLINLALFYFIINTSKSVNLKEGILLMVLTLFNFLTYYSYTNYIGVFEYFFKNKFMLIFTSGLIVTFMCLMDFIKMQKHNRAFKNR